MQDTHFPNGKQFLKIPTFTDSHNHAYKQNCLLTCNERIKTTKLPPAISILVIMA